MRLLYTLFAVLVTAVSLRAQSYPSTFFLNSNSPVCAGQTFVINVGYSSPPNGTTVSFRWSGPNSFTSNSYGTLQVPASAATAGVYSVTMTFSGATNGTATASTTLALGTPKPDALVSYVTGDGYRIASSSYQICGPTSLSLIANPDQAGSNNAATYQWTGPNGFSSNERSPVVSQGVAGLYIVTATYPNGCGTGKDTVTVSSFTPVVYAGSYSPGQHPQYVTSFCPGSSAEFRGSTSSLPTGTAVAYQWSGPNGFASTAQNFTLTNLTTAMAGSYSVTALFSGACSGTAVRTQAVQVGAPAVAAFSGDASGAGGSDASTFCPGTTFTLFALPANAATYRWSGPNGFVSSTRSNTLTNATAAMAGVYSVTATTSGGCSGVGSTTVALGTPRVAIRSRTLGANPYSSSSFCPGSSFELSPQAQASPPATYQWSGPNGFISTAKSLTFTNATTALTGFYNLTVTIVDGCVSSASTFINIRSPEFSVNAATVSQNPVISDAFCPGTAVRLYVYSFAPAPVTYQWSGPDGFTGSGQSLTLTSTTPAMSGVYSLTATFTGECSGTYTTSSRYISFGKPQLSLSRYSTNGFESPDDTYCPGAGVYLLASTAPANADVVSYRWRGPDGFTSTAKSFTLSALTPSMAGIYSLTAVYGGQCAGTRVDFAEVKVGTPRMPISIERADNSGTLGGTFPLCPGERYFLSANFSRSTLPADNQYLWTLPNGNTTTVRTLTIAAASTADAGRYILQTTYAGQCAGVVRDTMDVLIGPPQPTIYTERDFIAAGRSVALFAQGCYGSNNVRWSDGQTGQTIVVTPAQTTTYTASCAYGGCVGVSSAPLTVRIGNQPEADLSLVMNVGSRTPALSQPILVTLTAVNSSSVAATNVQITSRLPASLNLTNAGNMQVAGSTLVGSIVSLPANGSVVLSFQVAPTAAGVVRLAAQVTATDNPDPDSSPNSGTNDGQDDAAWVDFRTHQTGNAVLESPEPMPAALPTARPVLVDLPPGSVDLNLGLSVSSLAPALNEIISVTVLVDNYCSHRLLSPDVLCRLPAGLSFIDGAGFSAAGQDVLLTGGQYYPTWPRAFIFRARVTATISDSINAQISSSDWDDVDSTPGNGYDNGEDDTARITLRTGGL